YHLTITLRKQRANTKMIEGVRADIIPEADQRMQNFRRVQVRDGKKIWEIAARQARYFEANGEVVVEAPEVSFYLSDGQVVALRCGEGRLHMGKDEKTVMQMELKTDLQMQIGDLSFRTQEAVYDSEHDTISSLGAVQITGRGLVVEGQGYRVDMADRRLLLNADVHTTLTKEEG
ncbi:MAG: LPS export ABC transporter periplasmic protein LptC, partial [Deltaproteobacteria bacterium]|nr:LPS export ABC transporter periplasmic protein LptC [Deltaproteobacteria bacterium]